MFGSKLAGWRHQLEVTGRQVQAFTTARTAPEPRAHARSPLRTEAAMGPCLSVVAVRSRRIRARGQSCGGSRATEESLQNLVKILRRARCALKHLVVRVWHSAHEARSMLIHARGGWLCLTAGCQNLTLHMHRSVCATHAGKRSGGEPVHGKWQPKPVPPQAPGDTSSSQQARAATIAALTSTRRLLSRKSRWSTATSTSVWLWRKAEALQTL